MTKGPLSSFNPSGALYVSYFKSKGFTVDKTRGVFSDLHLLVLEFTNIVYCHVYVVKSCTGLLSAVLDDLRTTWSQGEK